MRLRTFKEVKTRLPLKKINLLFDLIIADQAEPDWRADVNLVFTTDTHIRRLNSRYRRKDKSTDVLSFVLDNPHDLGGTFGEIYISVPTARRQAVRYGLSLAHEFLRLFCHGLLHLFGYNHMNEADATKMGRLERQYLERVE
jgi:probable rRNA maturation factor